MKRKYYIFLLCIFFIFSLYTISNRYYTERRIANINTQLEPIYTEFTELKKELLNYNNCAELSDIYVKIASLHADINALRTEITAETKLENLETRIGLLEDKLVTLIYDLHELVDQVKLHSSAEHNLANIASRLEYIEKILTEVLNSETAATDKNVTQEPHGSSADTTVNGIYEDLSESYYGRLYIPSLDISVALYYGHQQYITDRLDSANIFIFEDFCGFTIADHSTQEFSKLLNVEIGTSGYIQNKYLGQIDIVCTDIRTGYNNGKYIVDENGINTMNLTDYMMYTCLLDRDGVLISLWSKQSYIPTN